MCFPGPNPTTVELRRMRSRSLSPPADNRTQNSWVEDEEVTIFNVLLFYSYFCFLNFPDQIMLELLVR